MDAKIKIGWASRDITPNRPVMVRGLFNLRVATRVNDPLTLTALALDGAADQAVFVSIDTAGVDEDVIAACREAVGKAVPDLDARKLVLNATHTHTAPFAGGRGGLQTEADYVEALRARFPDYMPVAEYTQLLVDAVASAVREAWETCREGSAGWGYSYAVVGENRRIRYFDDRAVMYGKTSEPDFSHVEGHVDHTVNLLFTYGQDGGLTGVVVNVASPSQASESGQDFLSADYWHETRNELRRRYGPNLFVLPQCSAAGDQTPHRLIGTRAEDRMLRLKHGSGLREQGNRALRLDIARRLADAVEDAEPAVRKDLRNQLELQHEIHHMELPHWDVTDEECAMLQEEVAKLRAQLKKVGDADPLARQYTALRSRIAWCQRAIDRYESPLESVPIDMHVIRFGDVAFVTVPFEYYLDFGDRMKGRSAALQTFVVQLAGAGGYLPTERAARGRSYGAIPPSCRVAPRGGQMIVDEAIDTIARMFAETT